MRICFRAGGPGGCVHDASSDVSRKVVALVARLRLVQSQLADEAADVRREQLDGEVSRALQSIAASDREPFLKELMSAFPTADGGGGGGAGRNGAATQATTKVVEVVKPRDLSFEELVEALVKQWGLATPEQKAQAAAKLTASGVTPSGGGGGTGLSEAMVRELRGKLALGTGDMPDAARVTELSAAMFDFAMGVDRLVWGMWSKKLAPSSGLRSNGTLQRFLREYVTGRGDAAGGGHVAPEVRRLLQMTIAVVSSIGQAGTAFGEKFVSQLTPGAIEDSIGDSAFRSKDADCWKAYKLRAGSLDRQAIDAEITQAIARFVEDWMRKSGL